MADNDGAYVTYDELIIEMYQGSSPKVVATATTLSSKTTDAAGDVFNHTGSAPALYSVLEQAGESAIVIGFPASGKIQINKTGALNLIINGTANFLACTSVPKKKGETLIAQAMSQVDLITGQFFNKRSGTFLIEGNNTGLLHLPVPIIAITSLKINGIDTALTEGALYDFVAFKGRSSPADDRRNPKISLKTGKGRSSIFTDGASNNVFMKDQIQTVVGSFGFLEASGATPSLIKRATLILTIKEINVPLIDTATQETGPLKRKKVDIHEVEFFELKGETELNTPTGNREVDQILTKYKAPYRISGSFRERGLDARDY